MTILFFNSVGYVHVDLSTKKKYDIFSSRKLAFFSLLRNSHLGHLVTTEAKGCVFFAENSFLISVIAASEFSVLSLEKVAKAFHREHKHRIWYT